MKKPLWSIILIIAAIFLLLTSALSGRLPRSCVDLAKLIDSRQASVTDGGFISLVRGMTLNSDVKNLLSPAGSDGPFDLFNLHGQCGSAETLVERVAAQERWPEFGQLRIEAPGALGYVVVFLMVGLMLLLVRPRLA